MRINIERAALLAALDRVRSVVETRNTIPILSNVLLEVDGGQLSLTATDLDMEARAVAFTTDLATESGQITVPVGTFYDIVRKLPLGAEVSLSYSGDDPRLVVRAGRSKFNLPVLPAGDFPIFGATGLPAETTFPAASLIKLVDMVGFCMSTEETRYYLNGLYFHVADGRVRAVSTDGHRLALCDVDLPEGFAPPAGVIIPRKTIKELRRMIDGVETVTVQISEQKIRFTTPNGAALSSKVIDGSFPDYMRVIPRDNDKIVKVDPALLQAAVDRVATISGEKSRAAKFGFGTDMVTVTVRNMDAGVAVEEVELEYTGEPVELGFNARYVLDVMGKMKGVSCRLDIGDPVAPCLVLDESDPDVKFVLMPLRV